MTSALFLNFFFVEIFVFDLYFVILNSLSTYFRFMPLTLNLRLTQKLGLPFLKSAFNSLNLTVAII